MCVSHIVKMFKTCKKSMCNLIKETIHIDYYAQYKIPTHINVDVVPS